MHSSLCCSSFMRTRCKTQKSLRLSDDDDEEDDEEEGKAEGL